MEVGTNRPRLDGKLIRSRLKEGAPIARLATEYGVARAAIYYHIRTGSGLTRRPTCRHCKSKVACRPRGLCWGCHSDLSVRAKYPITSKYARQGCGLRDPRKLPPEPTSAPPGSLEKLGVLAARAAAGQRLWHPLDAVCVRRRTRS